MKFFSPTPPAPPPAPVTTAVQAPSPGPTGASNDAPAAAAVAGAPAPTTVLPERDATIETPAERFVFSNRGASLRHATLLEPKYLPKKGEQGAHAAGIDLVHAGDPKLAPLRIN